MKTNTVDSKRLLESASKNISVKSTSELLDSKSLILKLASGRTLKSIGSDIKHLFSLVWDCSTGKYKQLPAKSLMAASAALIYLVSPIDLIADTIPVLGLVDDLKVLQFCLKMIGKDLTKYKAWKEEFSSPNLSKTING